jgi:2-methylisocitrate lyase-like PEP mutase family enzyme
MTPQHEKARRFHALHHAGRILVLPNAWDAASARVFELAGAPAIATTSAGVAASLGHPDGEAAPRDLVLAAVARIVAAVDVPVSVDVESGWGASVDDVRETVAAVLAAGAVGVNLEDRLAEPGVLAERIRVAHEVARHVDVPLFVNARTDVYLRSSADPVAKLADAVRRLRVYEAAGADGLFAPGLDDAATIREIVAAVARPLNVLAGAGVPPARELERLGVARVSVGSGPMRATLGLVRRIAEELLGEGTYGRFLTDAPSHAEVNAMLARPR